MRKAVLAAIALLVIVWGWLSAFSYFDPVRLCRIHIDVDLLDGNRSAIRRAIRLVRREDPVAYLALCRFVDRIVEERCAAGDPGADPTLRGAAVIPDERLDPALRHARTAPGCYLKGSRVVILQRVDEPAVRRRAEALKRLAVYSQDFWLAHRARPAGGGRSR